MSGWFLHEVVIAGALDENETAGQAPARPTGTDDTRQKDIKMTRLKLVTLVIFAVGVSALMTTDLAAQDGAALVKQRQTEMGQMGKAFRAVKPILKGENANVMDAMPSAVTWHTNALKIVANFPPDTGRDAVPDSRAKPEVWSKRSDFEAAAEKLVAEAEKLVAVTKVNEINAFRAQFKLFAQACSGCHKGPKKEGGKFRFPKQE
jgi:cytochrome c556